MKGYNCGATLEHPRSQPNFGGTQLQKHGLTLASTTPTSVLESCGFPTPNGPDCTSRPSDALEIGTNQKSMT